MCFPAFMVRFMVRLFEKTPDLRDRCLYFVDLKNLRNAGVFCLAGRAQVCGGWFILAENGAAGESEAMKSLFEIQGNEGKRF